MEVILRLYLLSLIGGKKIEEKKTKEKKDEKNKPENDNVTCVSYREGWSKHVGQCAWLPIYTQAQNNPNNNSYSLRRDCIRCLERKPLIKSYKNSI